MKLLLRVMLVAAAIAWCAPISSALAQAYDTPTIELVETTRYSVTVRIHAGASGMPAGFGLDWMRKSDYDTGGWNSTYYYCSFWGTATWNFEPGNDSYLLAPNQSQIVELGDVFDETGMSADYFDELEPGTQYVVRMYALGDANGDVSDYSGTILGDTKPKDPDCVFSQGYWKNHSNAWPVASLTLGSVSYTKTQLLSILNKAAQGNGLIILAKQLIAAKLNLAMGANPSPVSSTISAADAQIGSLVIPPVGSGFLTPNSTSIKSKTLDDFNNGKIPTDCTPTPAHSTSWGSIKTHYR
ncbi:MAG: hypothetical protein HOP12_13105 [Candidatus Eisenbacteria bacterium]|uniref:Fibronectin type III domain-containing protein n=1 Tax=Eiseniibacteriota bacterium TaxID=2212470 RepID=A0A849SI75_UNCEI|nr:hypothetical protein [Candidatus Eisenbacteria bacterium]